MTAALERVLRATDAARLDCTAEDVADALWLAQYLPARPLPQPADAPPTDPSAVREPPTEPAPTSPTTSAAPPTAEPKPPPPEVGAGRVAEVFAPSAAAAAQRRGGRVLWAPAPAALARALEVVRALRPLIRRVPSRTRREIDVEGTVRRIAEERVLEPVLRGVPDRWLDLTLVADVSASMAPWRPTLAELRKLVERLGAFGRVALWCWNADRGLPNLYPAAGRRPGRGADHDPKELIQPGGRHLILVLTDCVSSAWHTGEAVECLARWARSGPVALVQLLPESLWPRTALGRATPVRLLAGGAAAANARLGARPLSAAWDFLDDTDDDEDDDTAPEPETVAVPVMTLEPRSLRRWARLLTGAGDAWAPGYRFTVHATAVQQPASTTTTADGSEIVRRFLQVATTPARQLARLLAAAPVVSLPVMRTIRKTLLPGEAGQAHDAEVLLGDLLRVAASGEDDRDPEGTLYEFRPGVRERLLDDLPGPDVRLVLKAISDYIEDHLGFERGRFRLILDFPETTDAGELTTSEAPVACILTGVLSRLGGAFAKFAPAAEPVKPVEGPPERPTSGRDFKLVGVHRQRFAIALSSAFPRWESLAELLDAKLGVPLRTIASRGPLVDVMLQIIQWAESQGRVHELIEQAYSANPDNLELRSLLLELALFPVAGVPSDWSLLRQLGRSVQAAARFDDPAAFLERIDRAKRAVCRIVTPGSTWSTGFLVSPDTVLTVYHGIEEVDRTWMKPDQVTIEFDGAAGPNGEQPTGPVLCKLASNNWLLAYSRKVNADTGLDFALLRLERAIGAEPVSAEATAPRGWLKPSNDGVALAAAEPVFILHHGRLDEGWPLGPLQVAVGFVREAPSANQIHYTANLRQGSSGAPCLRADGSVVAMHRRRVPGGPEREGIPMSAIVADLASRGLAVLLESLDRSAPDSPVGARPAELPDLEQPPRWWVRVKGTGRSDFSERTRLTCKEFGESLARAGFGLVGGGETGVDLLVARAYSEALASMGWSAQTAIKQVVPHGEVPWVRRMSAREFPPVRVIEVELDRHGELRASVEQADVVVLISGGSATAELADYALEIHKPVLPLAATGEIARGIYQRMVSRWRYDPVPGLEMHEFERLAGLTPAVAEQAVELLELMANRSALGTDTNDPQKGRWGGQARRDGRELTAEVKAQPGTARWFKIELTVRCTDPTLPLTGAVTFHLHDTFAEPVRRVRVQNGMARLELDAYEEFTVGAEVEEGDRRTRLELDLADVDAPPGFKSVAATEDRSQTPPPPDPSSGPDVRTLVEHARRDIASIRGLSDDFSSYKSLYERLHHLRFQYLPALANAAKLFPKDDQSAQDLKHLTAELRNEATIARQDAEPLPAREGEWTAYVVQVMDVLERRVNDGDQTGVAEALARLRSVVHEFPRVSFRLEETVYRIPLETLIAAVRELSRHPVSPTEILLANLDSLEQFRSRLARLIGEYREWEWLDNQFTVAETTPGRTAADRFPQWPEVRERILGLCDRNPDQPWAQQIRRLTGALETLSETGDVRRFDRSFTNLRRAASERSLAVASELADVIDQIVSSTEALDDLLEASLPKA